MASSNPRQSGAQVQLPALPRTGHATCILQSWHNTDSQQDVHTEKAGTKIMYSTRPNCRMVGTTLPLPALLDAMCTRTHRPLKERDRLIVTAILWKPHFPNALLPGTRPELHVLVVKSHRVENPIAVGGSSCMKNRVAEKSVHIRVQ